MPDKTYKNETRIPMPLYIRKTRQQCNESATLLYFFAGLAIAFADIAAIAHFANSVVESIVLGILLIPTAVFVTLCASKLRE